MRVHCVHCVPSKRGAAKIAYGLLSTLSGYHDRVRSHGAISRLQIARGINYVYFPRDPPRDPPPENITRVPQPRVSRMKMAF